MDKGTKKRNNYNSAVIEYIVKKYGVSKTYIRQSIDGTRKGVTCDILKKEYHKQEAAVNSALKKVLK